MLQKPQEDDEMEPGSCIIEDDAEDKEVMCREGFEESKYKFDHFITVSRPCIKAMEFFSIFFQVMLED